MITSAIKIRVLVIGSLLPLAGCYQQETPEQYAKNPVGCEQHRPEWYAEKVRTKDGQDELRNLIRDDEMRAKVHELRTKLITATEKERFDELGKAINCQVEIKWAMDTLIGNGLRFEMK